MADELAVDDGMVEECGRRWWRRGWLGCVTSDDDARNDAGVAWGADLQRGVGGGR